MLARSRARVLLRATAVVTTFTGCCALPAVSLARARDAPPLASSSSPASSSSATPSSALLCFAAVADAQYADIPNTRGRYYRNVLNVLERAVHYFNTSTSASPTSSSSSSLSAATASPTPSLHFMLHAGDIVDFYNTVGDNAEDQGRATQQALDQVMSKLSQVHCKKTVFLVGNHELYNWSRQQLCQGIAWSKGILRFGADANESDDHHDMTTPSSVSPPTHLSDGAPEDTRPPLWHSFVPCAGWRVIVLDSYHHSIYSRGRGAGVPPFNYELDQAALAQVAKHNPGIGEFARLHPGSNILCDYFAGLTPGPNMRWVPYNGGVGDKQLQWLRQTLQRSATLKERVVVMTHALVHPDTSKGHKTLLWDYDRLLDVLRSPVASSVQLVVSGHQHEGGFTTDPESGIQFVVLESPLNSPPDLPGPFVVFEQKDMQSLELRGFCNANSHLFPHAVHGDHASRLLKLRGLSGDVAGDQTNQEKRSQPRH